MRVLAFSGSPRKQGNTEILVNHTLQAVVEEGLDTELVRLLDYTINPCTACEDCKGEESCPIDDDLLLLYEKMKQADAIIMASPVYFGSATPPIKALMDRAGYIAINNGYVFNGKAGGPLAVAGREGANFTISQMAFWFYYNGFIIPGASSWNVAFGRDKGEVLNDHRGLNTAWEFGKNLSYLVKKLAG